jgi:hypothetical protein
MGIFSRLFKTKKQGISIEEKIQIGEILETINTICKRKNELYKIGIIDISFDQMMIERLTISEFYKEGLLDMLGEKKDYDGKKYKYKDKLLELVNSSELNEQNILIVHYIKGFLSGIKRSLYGEVNKIKEEDLYSYDFQNISIIQISQGVKVDNYDSNEIMNGVKEMNEKLRKIQESIKK